MQCLSLRGGRKEGSQARRKEGREEGRKEGRKGKEKKADCFIPHWVLWFGVSYVSTMF